MVSHHKAEIFYVVSPLQPRGLCRFHERNEAQPSHYRYPLILQPFLMSDIPSHVFVEDVLLPNVLDISGEIIRCKDKRDSL